MRRLVLVNALLVLASAGLAAYIGWELTRPLPEPDPARSRPAASPTGAAPSSPGAAPAQPGAYATVASRNLFSPTRTEAPPAAASPATQPPVQALPKPHLYGVVVRDEAPIAYLEDPVTKRVAGYRVGDSIAGGTVQRIAADRVVLARPDGPLDVRLHDPSKPRPPAPGPASAETGPGGAAPVHRPPGVVRPAQPPSALVPGAGPAGAAGRRLPPSLLRRLPQPDSAPADAPPR
jgi:hypothetical protein